MANPECPECGSDKTFQPRKDGRLWRCKTCGSYFDPADDGTYDFRDPTRRLQRQEEMSRRRREKLDGR